MVMATQGDTRVHPNGSRPGVLAPPGTASLIGKTLAATRPAARRAAAARAAGRAWRAFRPAALSTSAYGCAAAGAYVAAGLWPGLLTAAAALLLLDWQSKHPPPPVIVDDPDLPGGVG